MEVAEILETLKAREAEYYADATAKNDISPYRMGRMNELTMIIKLIEGGH